MPRTAYDFCADNNDDYGVTPEQKAREEIDRQLAACGWLIQDHKAMNILAGPGVAVQEFPLKTDFADYLLYLDGKVIGLIEAKPGGYTLTGVEIQSSKYTLGLPDGIPHYRKPLPFAYECWTSSAPLPQNCAGRING